MQDIKPVVLVILDGWGHREENQHNAIAAAQTPFFDKIWREFPHTLLEASGLHVGLPEGQMGNSEVGHITIGAGKIIDTDLVRISKAAINNEFKNNPAFIDLFNHVKENHSILHVMGLVGPGGIHSHSDHLLAFLKTAKAAGVKKVAIHAFTDGRDTAPQSSVAYLKEIEDLLEELKIGLIATLSGRFYAMDRDKNWDRLGKAEKAIFEARGNISPAKPSETMASLHKMGLLDEHVEPIIFLDENGRTYPISPNDGLFFFNFRADRARQLSQKIAAKANDENLFFVTMSQYDPSIKSHVAFPPVDIETTLAAEIAKADLAQAHIAETEKFAHATYYLNGGKNDPHHKERHILIDSRKDVSTHDEAPEMRAQEITNQALEFIDVQTPFIFLNYANPDMVGHTANQAAIKTAIETVDHELERLHDKIKSVGGKLFVTADHGNAEQNIDPEGNPHTAHTTNQVPAILIDYSSSRVEKSLSSGNLADIAPTILDLLNIEKPAQMTGRSLLK